MTSKLSYCGLFFYRLFIVLQLALAIYYSNRAIKLWNESPIVVSVDTEQISNVKFPAVTVCHPITWTWASITTLLDHLDASGNIVNKFVSKNIGQVCHQHLLSKN